MTGGDSGIGRAVAIAFACEGANVAIAYLDEDEDARETVRWVEDAGRRALAIQGDLREPRRCRESVERTVAGRGVRVYCVAPGPVWTPLTPATRLPEDVSSHGANAYWGGPAQPAELAPSYVFLASTDSRYHTGEVLASTGFTTVSR